MRERQRDRDRKRRGEREMEGNFTVRDLRYINLLQCMDLNRILIQINDF